MDQDTNAPSIKKNGVIKLVIWIHEKWLNISFFYTSNNRRPHKIRERIFFFAFLPTSLVRLYGCFKKILLGNWIIKCHKESVTLTKKNTTEREKSFQWGSLTALWLNLMHMYLSLSSLGYEWNFTIQFTERKIWFYFFIYQKILSLCTEQREKASETTKIFSARFFFCL